MIDAAERTSPMQVLRTDRMAAFVDVDHGAEVVRLIDVQRGRDLLGHPPFAAARPTPGPHDERSWTAGYRGGWQLCAPNYGQPCRHDGERHGFHGDASASAWELVRAGPAEITVRWSGHGTRLERRLRLTDTGLEAQTTARCTAPRPVPICAVEHLALGAEVLHPGFELTLPRALAYEIDDVDGPSHPPADARPWPAVLGLDGRHRDDRRFAAGGAWSHLQVLRDLPVGHARVHNQATGLRVDLRWSGEVLRHLLVWNERHGLGGDWRHATEILCLEPASVPHGMGLARAVADGDAVWLDPGQATSWALAIDTTDEAMGAAR